jgi:hypothetical protein
MALEIELTDMTNGTTRRVALPEEVPMRELLPTLLGKLGIETNRQGGAWDLRLVHKAPGERFEYGQDDTLASRDTKQGDVVGLSYEFVAG